MKIRIRSKVAAALLVPVLALVAVAGWEVRAARQDADRIDEQTDLALVALGHRSVTASLQAERAFVAVDVVGLAEVTEMGASTYQDARDAVDESVIALQNGLLGYDQRVQDAFSPAIASLARLQELREDYEDFDGVRGLESFAFAAELFDGYGEVIGAFFTATSTLAAQVDDADLRNGVELVDAANRRSEVLAATTSVLALDVLSGEVTEDGRALVGAGAAQIRQLDERIAQLATGPYASLVAADDTDPVLGLFDDFANGRNVDLAQILGAGALGESSLLDGATSTLVAQANRLSSDAVDTQRAVVIAAAAVLILAILVTYFSTVSITRPLRALRVEAERMAERRLPQAVQSVLATPMGEDVLLPSVDEIRITTRDEVGDVVDALNDVQRRTLGLAVDQALLRHNIAESFVNLGRRNQQLLDRQLDFITDLERNETDPEILDSLFKLDHLATRMRRNAESLLVLAGADTPREWGDPVPVADVVRAGLGEVEAFQRVSIRHLDDGMVLGSLVSGLAHVVAELVENALAFSPPDENVEIKGRWAADDYVIAIADNGIGMDVDSLEDANRRLAGRESYTVAPSKYLGHYVAGHLASRMDLKVRIQDDPAGGLVATIAIPGAAMHGGSEAEPTGARAALSSADVPGAVAAPSLPEPAETEAQSPAAPSGDPVASHAAVPSGRAPDPVAPSGAPSPTTGPSPATTPSGLPVRVPGAQRPGNTPIERLHPPSTSPTEGGRSAEPAADSDADGGDVLLGFLNAFDDSADEPAEPEVPAMIEGEDRER